MISVLVVLHFFQERMFVERIRNPTRKLVVVQITVTMDTPIINTYIITAMCTNLICSMEFNNFVRYE